MFTGNSLKSSRGGAWFKDGGTGGWCTKGGAAGAAGGATRRGV